MKRIILIMTLLRLTAFAGGQDITLHVEPHRLRDTVIVEVKVSIPRGFNLYANPLGPGIGKPLNLYVNSVPGRAGVDVRWVEARKSAPKRYDPPIGDWVWAYDKEARFFVKGVVEGGPSDGSSGGGQEKKYEVIIEALICKTSCVPIIKSAGFDAPLRSISKIPLVLPWWSDYSRAEPMVFKSGAPDTAGGVLNFCPATGEAGLDLGLGGMSPLGGIGGDDGNNVNVSNAVNANNINVNNTNINNDNGGLVWDYVPVEDRRSYSFLTAILFAFLAGLAMNLTPCIFPMLGVRVLSFVESARESRRRAVLRSVMFSFGIVAVFLLLAAFAAFAGFSWGQQFQNPAVMVGIISMVFLFALGMFDFYTLAAPSAVGNAERRIRSAFFGDFLKGAAATVMATPCAGPFLGALLAWALLQEPAVIFAVFSVMGAGMSFPYILLSSSSKLMKLLPRPGRWIEDFKRAMGFFLLVFAVILMKSLDPGLTVTAVGIALSILAAASVNKRFASFGEPAGKRLTVGLLSLVLLAAGVAASVVYLRVEPPVAYGGGAGGQSNYTSLVGYDAVNPGQSVGNDIINPIQSVGNDITNPTVPVWIDFSPAVLRAAHEEGRNVILNFTASWCTNCKLNKVSVLDAEAARQLYIDKNVLLLTADITNRHPSAESLLHHLGSRSIPFLAIFPSDSPKTPVVMRDIIYKDKYLEALRGLKAKD